MLKRISARCYKQLLIAKCMNKMDSLKTTYIALCGQVGLHGHGMFNHELGPDLAEQI